jgi:hypothetical protein
MSGSTRYPAFSAVRSYRHLVGDAEADAGPGTGPALNAAASKERVVPAVLETTAGCLPARPCLLRRRLGLVL